MQAKVEELYRRFNSESDKQPCVRQTPECVALQLGHLVRVCSKHKLNPNDNTWNQSLLRIAEIVRDIPALCLPNDNVQHHRRLYNGDGASEHSRCSWVPELKIATSDALHAVEGLKLSSLPTG